MKRISFSGSVTGLLGDVRMRLTILAPSFGFVESEAGLLVMAG